MSHENVEIVRAFVEAAGRDPKEGSSYLADDLEFIPFRHSTDRREDPLDS